MNLLSTRYLKRFFKPKSIAVFGASEKDNSMGGVVLHNLIEGGYEGKLMAVNKRGYDSVHGITCYSNLSKLPEMPDLAIICSPPESVADLVRRLGIKMVKAALILTGGLSRSRDPMGKNLRDEIMDAARTHGVRILGPDCMGMLVSGNHMNASYSHLNIRKGKVSYVGQSGLLGTAMIDWANGQEIGFSHFLTLGEGVDIDLPSIIDYYAQDPYTQSILIQLDHLVGSSRNLLSSLRSASRNKLVLVLKSNMIFTEDKEHLPALGIKDEDLVYDAALRRAGVVRVSTVDQLYNALETLSRMKPMRGERLALVCNGMGPNALATDQLLRNGGELSELSDETVTALRGVLANHWNLKNPIDLHADATPERFAQVTQLLTKDPHVDAVLVIHAPTRMAPGAETAKAIINVARNTPRNILTCWMGRSTAIESRNHFNAVGVPTFITPEEAVNAFMHMVEFRRNQEVMRQTPAPFVDPNEQNHLQAKQLIAEALAEGRDYLTHSESMDLLDQYDIPISHSQYADDVDGVVKIAKRLGGTVAVKVMHPENVYPFNYDNRQSPRWKDLALDLFSAEEVRQAATKLAFRVQERFPEGPKGFCVQQMKRGYQSLQFNLGITRDPVFGPLLLFGKGGYSVDVLADRQVMLPPLNLSLARRLISTSHMYSVLKESSTQLERDIEQLSDLLIKLSQMVVELPNLKGLEINPLLVNRRGVLAVDVAVSLGEPSVLAISPYPEYLSEHISLRKSGRKAIVRAIRGEDEPNHLAFYNKLSPESIRLRYFYSRGIPTHQELANWTQIDYDREMAFIVTAPQQGKPGWETLGVVRAVTDADNVRAEFSVVIRDDLQGEGLGVVLMQKVIDYCTARGTLLLMGSTLTANKGMQGLAQKLGFKNHYNMEEDVVEMEMMLNEPTEDWQRTRLKG
ncbi:bifunctional acetate--CoA ligase family protein/GNAT family N-acetyltransferase [Amphritea sp. 1_MG-2023]|uniref:bifunctional acetate--CoA ligase family protein/GNAT family N-acetyltransferase n=1 Tax=Amphritea sp. 1_MG-2023 TaxID=3062670 RepID=UPI0026E2D496|nr:bifunctional acetate--CoA ligase family protein/GNAT family N-acetyltransferase [Amphritea sp. 1_MG-2023]MDO6564915.1 bifunctional acetate--CoA ligase family protein/GNAT family N-acetyltransferase [Amphritea sp. 1_MG-2023]